MTEMEMKQASLGHALKRKVQTDILSTLSSNILLLYILSISLLFQSISVIMSYHGQYKPHSKDGRGTILTEPKPQYYKTAMLFLGFSILSKII